MPFFNPWWKNSFKLRLSVDAKAIWGKVNGEMYVYMSPEYLPFVHKWHTGHSWETQLYSVGWGYCHVDPMNNPRTSSSGLQTLSAPWCGASPAKSLAQSA